MAVQAFGFAKHFKGLLPHPTGAVPGVHRGLRGLFAFACRIIRPLDGDARRRCNETGPLNAAPTEENISVTHAESKPWRSIYPIAPTPFTATGDLDPDGQRGGLDGRMAQ